MMRPLILYMRYLATLMAALAVVGCDSIDAPPSQAPVVVEAFLFADEPVQDIRLLQAVPIDTSDSTETPINDASVRIIHGGRDFPLAAQGSDGWYAYTGADLEIMIGETYGLVIDWNGSRITAETTVPAPPTGVRMATTQLAIPRPTQNPLAFRDVIRSLALETPLTIEWDNPEGSLYFITLETPSTGTPDYLLPEFVRERFSGLRLITRPTEANFYDIPLLSLEVVASYTATVYAVNQEYADLYENREQDSRDLNEPPTNIQGGLGVFSAFSGIQVDFELIRE